MTNEEQIALLRAVKERLFAKGWTRLQLGDSVTGPNCILGAIYASMGLYWTENNTEELKIAYSQGVNQIANTFEGAIGLGSIASFNDRVGRTFDEIVDAIDLTIKKLETL